MVESWQRTSWMVRCSYHNKWDFSFVRQIALHLPTGQTDGIKHKDLRASFGHVQNKILWTTFTLLKREDLKVTWNKQTKILSWLHWQHHGKYWFHNPTLKIIIFIQQLLLFWDRVSYTSGLSQDLHVTEKDNQVLFLLLPPPSAGTTGVHQYPKCMWCWVPGLFV